MTALVNGEARHAAVAQWRAAAAGGETLTGAQLGERFDRSARWGRERIAEAKAAELPVPVAATAVERHDSGETQVTTITQHVSPDKLPVDDVPPQPERRPWFDRVVVLLVAVVAAAASYGHMRAVAVMAGEPEWIAYLFPLTVDGLVLAALRRGDEGRWWLALALAVSVASNVAAAEPTVLGRLVSAWPPLALYGTHRLLHRR